MRYVVVLCALLFAQTSFADVDLGKAADSKEIKKTLQKVKSTSAYDQISKEALLTYYLLLKSDLIAAQKVNGTLGKIESDGWRTTAQTATYVVSLGAPVYLGYKFLKYLLVAPVRTLGATARAYDQTVNYAQKAKAAGSNFNDPIVWEKVAKPQFAKIPEGLVRAAGAFISGGLKTAVGTVVFGGVVYYAWNFNEALFVSEDKYNVLVMEVDNKINVLQQEMGDKVSEETVGYVVPSK